MLAGDSDDLYVTYRSWFDSTLDASPLVVTAFVRNPDHSWTRFDEEHVERSWPIDDVARVAPASRLPHRANCRICRFDRGSRPSRRVRTMVEFSFSRLDRMTNIVPIVQFRS